MKTLATLSLRAGAIVASLALPALAQDDQAPRNEVSAGATYSSLYGAVAIVGAELADIGGSGVDFSADIRKGQTGYGGTARLRYVRPLATPQFGSDARLTFGAGIAASNWQDDSYNSRSDTLSVALDAQAAEQLGYTLRLFWQGDALSDPKASASPLVTAALGESSSAGVTAELHLGHLQGGVLPVAGAAVDGGVTWAGLGSRKTASVFVSGTAAQPVATGTTLVLRAEAGQVRGENGAPAGLLDRAFLGGTGGPRGFGFGGVGPRDYVAGSVDTPLGGQRYSTASAELRRDLSDRLSLGAFVDAGAVWDLGDAPVAGASGIIDDSRILRAAGGLAIYWDTPLGKVNLTLATPVKRQKTDSFNEISLGFLSSF